jgi:type IV secretory pathway TrbD component
MSTTSLQPTRLARTNIRVGASRGLILLAAAVSFVLSVSLWFSGHQLQGVFVGLWVPSILALGALVVPPSGRS